MVDLVRGFQDPDGGSKGLSWIQKDPSDKKDYERDWAAFLGVGETISSVTWVIYDNNWVEIATPSGDDLKQPASPAASNTTTTATIWLEKGAAGSRYLVTCRVTTSAGRIADESFQVRVLQR
jgi:hypothetical protein